MMMMTMMMLLATTTTIAKTATTTTTILTASATMEYEKQRYRNLKYEAARQEIEEEMLAKTGKTNPNGTLPM